MTNKEQAFDPNSKKDALALAIENNLCGLCRPMGLPMCKGHAKTGGGSGSGGSGDKASYQEDTSLLKQPTQIDTEMTPIIQEFEKEKKIWIQSQLLNDKVINDEAGLLLIESDRLRGNLTFRAKPGLSKAEIEMVTQFFKAVKAQFDEFKNQLTEQGVSTHQFKAELKDNQLAIHIPNPKYYDAFIKHLENQNLLPVPKPKQIETPELNKQKAFNPNPFSMRLERK